MSWNAEKKIGAVYAPNPKSINPAIDVIHVQGFKWVVNPGTFCEGQILVINDEGMYKAMVHEGWPPAEIPPEYLQ